MFKTKHRNYEIEYSEHDEKWKCAELKKTSSQLAKLKVNIDKFLEKESDFKKRFERVDAFLDTCSEYEKVTITSLADDDYGTPKAWVSNGGKRSKESISKLYKITKSNNQLFAEIEKLDLEINDLTSVKRGKEQQLEKWNYEELSKPAQNGKD